MDPPSKRRKIEFRDGHWLKHLQFHARAHIKGAQQVLRPHHVHVHLQGQNEKGQNEANPAQLPSEEVAAGKTKRNFTTPRLNTRQLANDADAASNAASSVAQPVDNAASGVAHDAATALPDTGVNVQGSTPATQAPGVVSPLPAVAAAAARETALAQQEAAAAKANPLVPSADGPAPPQEVSSPAAAAAADGRAAVAGVAKSTGAAGAASLPDGLASRLASLLASQPSAGAGMRNSPSMSAPSGPNPTSSPALGASNNFNASSSITSPQSALPTTSLSAASRASVSSMEAALLLSQSMASMESMLSASSMAAPTTLLTTTSGQGLVSTSSAAAPTSTPFANGNPTPTEGGAAGASSSNTSSSKSEGGGGNSPPARVLVGGIVGGVAGAVLVVVALLFLLRWKKGQLGRQRNISPPVPQSAGAGSAALGGGMVERSSAGRHFPAAAAALLSRFRPSSTQTGTSASSMMHGERGFQKLSGRKLPSVLHHGGDGYGDDVPVLPAAAVAATAASQDPPSRSGRPLAPGQDRFAGLAPGLRPESPTNRDISGSSFYRDSQGAYGGVIRDSTTSDQTDPSSSSPISSPMFPSPPTSNLPFAGAGQAHGSPNPAGMLNLRPGPARQPVIQQGGVVPTTSSRGPHPPSNGRFAPSPIAEVPQDAVGRSLPNQDGSRQSRFRESTTPP